MKTNGHGKAITGKLVQGEDGIWREVKEVKPRVKRVKSLEERQIDAMFRRVNRAIFGE